MKDYGFNCGISCRLTLPPLFAVCPNLLNPQISFVFSRFSLTPVNIEENVDKIIRKLKCLVLKVAVTDNQTDELATCIRKVIQ